MRPILLLAVAPLMLLAACERQPEVEAGAPALDAPSEAPELAGVDLTGDVNLLGTEPFWAVEIRPDGLRLMGPDREDVRAPNPGPRVHGTVAVWEARTDQGATLEITLTETACSDGMSDRTYPLTARVRLGEEVLTGCAAATAFIHGTDERGEPRD